MKIRSINLQNLFFGGANFPQSNGATTTCQC